MIAAMKIFLALFMLLCAADVTGRWTAAENLSPSRDREGMQGARVSNNGKFRDHFEASVPSPAVVIAK
jgi:hypothetical protein